MRRNPFMNERWGEEPYMKWWKAVDIWNERNGTRDKYFAIPVADSEVYNEIREIQKDPEEVAKVGPAKPSIQTIREREGKPIRERKSRLRSSPQVVSAVETGVREVIEKPVEVIEKPVEVIKKPVEVIEKPVEVVKKPRNLNEEGFYIYEPEPEPIEEPEEERMELFYNEDLKVWIDPETDLYYNEPEGITALGSVVHGKLQPFKVLKKR